MKKKFILALIVILGITSMYFLLNKKDSFRSESPALTNFLRQVNQMELQRQINRQYKQPELSQPEMEADDEKPTASSRNEVDEARQLQRRQIGLLYIQYLARQQQIVEDRERGLFESQSEEDRTRQLQAWAYWLQASAEITGDFSEAIDLKEQQRELLEVRLVNNFVAFNTRDGRSTEQYLDDAAKILDEYQLLMIELGFASGKFSRANLKERIILGRESESICDLVENDIYDSDTLVQKACYDAFSIFESFIIDYEHNFVLDKYEYI